MNNKKYLLDISLEIDAADISSSGEPDIIITKEIDGLTAIITLPVVKKDTAQGFIDGKTDACGWMPNCNNVEGFWLREKTIDIETGLQLVHDKTEHYFLPH